MTVRWSRRRLRPCGRSCARRAERQPAAVDEHGVAVVEEERRQHLHAGDALVAHVVEQELVLRVVAAAQRSRAGSAAHRPAAAAIRSAGPPRDESCAPARASRPPGRAASRRAPRTGRWPPRPPGSSGPAGARIAIGGDSAPGYTRASGQSGPIHDRREVAGSAHLFRDRPEPRVGHAAARARQQGRVAAHGARALGPHRALDLPLHRAVVRPGRWAGSSRTPSAADAAQSRGLRERADRRQVAPASADVHPEPEHEAVRHADAGEVRRHTWAGPRAIFTANAASSTSRRAQLEEARADGRGACWPSSRMSSSRSTRAAGDRLVRARDPDQLAARSSRARSGARARSSPRARTAACGRSWPANTSPPFITVMTSGFLPASRAVISPAMRSSAACTASALGRLPRNAGCSGHGRITVRTSSRKASRSSSTPLIAAASSGTTRRDGVRRGRARRAR